MPPTKEAVDCDRCGVEATSYEIRYFGPRDPQTGYQDQQIVCRACLDDDAEQSAMDAEDDEYWEAGDRKFHAAYEEGEI